MTEKQTDLDILKLHPYDPDTRTGFTTAIDKKIDDYMSYSKVKTFHTSAKHFKWIYVDGNTPPVTDAMNFGKKIHGALLEPSSFRKIFVVKPDKNDIKDVLNTVTDLKEELKNIGLKASGKKEDLATRLTDHDIKYKKRVFHFVESEFSKTIKKEQVVLTNNEADSIIASIQSISEHKIASKLISNGYAELQFYYNDEELGVVWYGMLDYVRYVEDKNGNRTAWITELKTTQNAHPFEFRKQIDKMDWHMQLWIYKRVVQGILGKDVVVKIIQIAIENKPPYILELFEPAQRMMDETAGYQVKDVIARMKDCLDTDIWPGYTQGAINEIDLPSYAYYRIEEQEEIDSGT